MQQTDRERKIQRHIRTRRATEGLTPTVTVRTEVSED